MKNIFIVLFTSGIVFFTGCSTTVVDGMTYNKNVTSKKGYRVQSFRDVFINYHLFADDAIHNIFPNGKVPDKIIVTDFVDVTSLDNRTRLGYVLSNNIKNSLINTYQANVIEAEVSKYFKISGNGLKILSRDTDKLRTTNLKVRYAMVGTYTETGSELIVFLKFIDLKTGIIKGSYAQTFPMGTGTRELLQNK